MRDLELFDNIDSATCVGLSENFAQLESVVHLTAEQLQFMYDRGWNILHSPIDLDIAWRYNFHKVSFHG